MSGPLAATSVAKEGSALAEVYSRGHLPAAFAVQAVMTAARGILDLVVPLDFAPVAVEVLAAPNSSELDSMRYFHFDCTKSTVQLLQYISLLYEYI